MAFAIIDNMLDMIMLRCSDIDVRLPWEYVAPEEMGFYPHILMMSRAFDGGINSDGEEKAATLCFSRVFTGVGR